MTAILITLAIINIILGIAVYQIGAEVHHLDEMITAISSKEYADSVQDDLSEIFDRLHAVEQVAANASNKAAANKRRLEKAVMLDD